MRIALVSNIIPHFQVGFYEGLARRHDLTVFCTGGSERYRDPRNPIGFGYFAGEYLRGFDLLPRVRVVPSLIPRLMRGGYGAVIGTVDGRFGLPATFFAARLAGMPYVLWTGMWSHPDTPFHRLSFPLLRHIYRRADAIMTYGEHVRKYLISLGVRGEKVFNAWHAIDNGPFEKSVSEADRADARCVMGAPSGPVALFVGRLAPEKGLDTLIRAASTSAVPDLHVVLVGDGPEAPRLKELAFHVGLRRIHFLPHQPWEDLRRFYAGADVFVLPSITTRTMKETWGVVVNEAMNQGCPVIASDAVGAAVGGLLEPGGNGLVVPEGNVAALRGALETVLLDRSRREEMSRRSREIIKGWTFEGMIQGAERALAWAVGRRSSGPRGLKHLRHPAVDCDPAGG